MKCSADVVTACDRLGDMCGFCSLHCPYDDCPVHKKDKGKIEMSFWNCTNCRFASVENGDCIKGHKPENKDYPKCGDCMRWPNPFAGPRDDYDYPED